MAAAMRIDMRLRLLLASRATESRTGLRMASPFLDQPSNILMGRPHVFRVQQATPSDL
jgi:hypothetical protein